MSKTLIKRKLSSLQGNINVFQCQYILMDPYTHTFAFILKYQLFLGLELSALQTKLSFLLLINWIEVKHQHQLLYHIHIREFGLDHVYNNIGHLWIPFIAILKSYL